MQFPDSDATCRWVREQTDWVILAFSGGKDSLCTWLKLRKHFDPKKIIPICMLMIPGVPGPDGTTVRGTLSYLQKTLDYYEEVFGQRIYRVPHTYFWWSLAHKVYQPPERLATIKLLARESRLPILDNKDYNKWIRDTIGIPDAWTATGLRMADNLQRRTLIKKHGSAMPGARTFYPVWDYTIEDVRTNLEQEGVKLSSFYKLAGRSMSGIDARFTWPIRENLPEDWELLKHWYPMVDVDIFRYESRERLLADQKRAKRAS